MKYRATLSGDTPIITDKSGCKHRHASTCAPGITPPPYPLPVPTGRDKRSGAGECVCIPGQPKAVFQRSGRIVKRSDSQRRSFSVAV
ncbi:MAG: hypothetical protein ACI30J_07765 [Paludibacteraceae bacterium]